MTFTALNFIRRTRNPLTYDYYPVQLAMPAQKSTFFTSQSVLAVIALARLTRDFLIWSPK